MEAIRSSETSGTTQRTTRRHIPEENTLQNHRCENLKSYIVVEVYRRFGGKYFLFLQKQKVNQARSQRREAEWVL
jgi:hypothetical protein